MLELHCQGWKELFLGDCSANSSLSLLRCLSFFPLLSFHQSYPFLSLATIKINYNRYAMKALIRSRPHSSTLSLGGVSAEIITLSKN